MTTAEWVDLEALLGAGQLAFAVCMLLRSWRRRRHRKHEQGRTRHVVQVPAGSHVDRLPDWYRSLPPAEHVWAALPVRTAPLPIPRRKP